MLFLSGDLVRPGSSDQLVRVLIFPPVLCNFFFFWFYLDYLFSFPPIGAFGSSHAGRDSFIVQSSPVCSPRGRVGYISFSLIND